MFERQLLFQEILKKENEILERAKKKYFGLQILAPKIFSLWILCQKRMERQKQKNKYFIYPRKKEKNYWLL